MTVAEARAAGTEVRGRPEAGVGERAARKHRRGGAGQLRCIGGQHAQEGDRHAGNIAFERRIARAVVDHRHRCGAVLLPEDGAIDARAGAAPRDHQLARDARVDIFGFAAAERNGARGGAQHEDRESAAGQRRAVGIDRRDAPPPSESHHRGRETRGRVHRRHADDTPARRGRSGDVGRRTGVARGGHHDDAGLGGVLCRQRIGGLRRAEGSTERHVDDVHVVFDGPVDRMGHDVGRTLAAEDANGIDVRLGRDSGSDLERLLECRAVVRSRVGCAVGIHTEARGGACDVAAVSVAVERVRIRVGGCLGGVGVSLCVHRAGVVGVADEVGAALHLGRVRPEQRRIGRLCAGSGCRLERGDGAGAAEVGVRVVDPGIDDRDLDAFAAQTRRALPHHRRANERHAHRVVRTMLQNRQDLDDARQRGERRDLVAIDFDLDSVQGMAEALEHAAAATRDFGFDALMLGRNLVFDRAPLNGGERAFRDACPSCRDGFGRHDDHDLDAAAALHAERNDSRLESLW